MYVAILNESSKRYALWRRLFGGNSVPVCSDRETVLQIAGRGETRGYRLDVRGLTLTQRATLAEEAAEELDMLPREVAESISDPNRGCLILVEDVEIIEQRGGVLVV